MHRKLLLNAFEKVKKEQGLIKKTHVSKFLSDYIFQDSRQQYGEKILRVNFNKAIKNNYEEISLKPFAAESLKNYLGVNNYNNIEIESKTESHKNIKNLLIKHKKKVVSLSIILVCIIIFATSKFKNEKWMVWNIDHYEETEFDTKVFQSNLLKIYKEDRIESFKMITPNCSTIYFSKTGNVKLWYGKNKNKELNYFTSYGLHPETGKTLKPITKYMIKKYICDSYSN